MEEKEDETPPADAASPEYDLEDAENARKVAKGAAILTAGTASVVALTLGVGGAAVVESLDKIPLLSGFEEALGVAVSAYYANKFKDRSSPPPGASPFASVWWRSSRRPPGWRV